MKIKELLGEAYGDDNFDLGNHGMELDKDDDGDKEGFKQKPIFDQLGKIIDSQSNPTPLNTVKTDDGETIEVDSNQAHELRKLLRAEGMKPQMKMRFTRDLQLSKNLHDFVDSKDYHKIGAVFMQKYM